MTKERKTLKEFSILILVLAAISLVRLVLDACMVGFDAASLEIEGASETLIKVSLIITFVLALLLLIPDVYVGIMGIKEANNPTGAKAYIVIALIITILYAIASVSSIVDICKGFNFSKLAELSNEVLNAAIFFLFYIQAKKVSANK